MGSLQPGNRVASPLPLLGCLCNPREYLPLMILKTCTADEPQLTQFPRMERRCNIQPTATRTNSSCQCLIFSGEVVTGVATDLEDVGYVIDGLHPTISSSSLTTFALPAELGLHSLPCLLPLPAIFLQLVCSPLLCVTLLFRSFFFVAGRSQPGYVL
ncbi:hypothetical protein BJV78DRAFT_428130 [Lactifluus subvellereus]|nr:hypothetical protein BJV78DRAFT_428130 [Lactifluus subvellereus]